MQGSFVSYLRVSTDAQGRSGLGLEAQRQAVAGYLNGRSLIAEVVEVESGRVNERPQLAMALQKCRLTGAALVVGKLDRLARNTRFLLNVLHGAGEGGVVFCDLPTIPAGPVGKFMVTQMASVAELEAGLISQRTRSALKAAKERGVKLGGFRGGPVPDPAKAVAARRAKADEFASRVAPIARTLQQDGLSLSAIARELQQRGIRTARGVQWSVQGVKNVLARGLGQ